MNRIRKYSSFVNAVLALTFLPSSRCLYILSSSIDLTDMDPVSSTLTSYSIDTVCQTISNTISSASQVYYPGELYPFKSFLEC